MGKKIDLSSDVFVGGVSLNFWWALYGLRPSYWEDIYIHYRNRDGKKIGYSTAIITKGYFRRYDKPDYKEMIDDACAWFGKSLDEILKAEDVVYGYGYDNPGNPDFYEVDFEAKRNAQGIKPCYIEIYNPSEEISQTVIIESVARFCKDFLGIQLPRVQIPKKRTEAYARRTLEEERKRWDELKPREGEKLEIRILPDFLRELFGPEEMPKLCGEIEYGFIRDGRYFVKLADGTEQAIGQPDLRLIRRIKLP